MPATSSFSRARYHLICYPKIRGKSIRYRLSQKPNNQLDAFCCKHFMKFPIVLCQSVKDDKVNTCNVIWAVVIHCIACVHITTYVQLIVAIVLYRLIYACILDSDVFLFRYLINSCICEDQVCREVFHFNSFLITRLMNPNK